MSTKYIFRTALATVAILTASISNAGNFGSAAEAKEMLENAIIAMYDNKTEALEAFTSGTHGFKDRDLYVACFLQGTGKGEMTAHGGLPKLVGTSGYSLIDAKGTNLGELLDQDTNGAILQAIYWWPRPGSDESVEKESYFATIGNQNCLVGYYK